jgi:hypothetical protein
MLEAIRESIAVNRQLQANLATQGEQNQQIVAALQAINAKFNPAANL